MMEKIKKSLRITRKRNSTGTAAPRPEPASYHANGPNTPVHGRYGSFSSRSGGDRTSWAGFSTSDSGYESLDGCGSSPQTCEAHDDTGSTFSPLDFGRPRLDRQSTYSSSVYSTDTPALEVLEPFPLVEEVDEEEDSEFSPARRRSGSNRPVEGNVETSPAGGLQPPRSRFARLNELPVASPRAAMFPEDVFDRVEMESGSQREEPKGKKGHKRGRSLGWGGGSSLSLVLLPSKLRRLSTPARSTSNLKDC